MLLIIISAALYSNTLKNPFIWSETSVILDNEDFRDLGNFKSFFSPRYWIDEHPFRITNIYRPLRIFSFALNYRWGKLNPIGWHIFNILVHIGCVLLLYFLANLLFKNRWLALLTGLLFACHPAHVEAITWIMSRDTAMATLFFLLSCFLFIKSQTGRYRVGNVGYYAGALISLILALLSREIAVTLPLILVLYIFCFLPKGERRHTLYKTSPFWGITLLYLGMRFGLQHESIAARAWARTCPGLGISLLSNILLVPKTVFFYLRQLLLPIWLCPDHNFSLPAAIFRNIPLALGFFLLLAVVIFILFKYSKGLAFSFAWILITMLPVANIIPIQGRLVAEQRLYLPNVGYCLFLALVLKRVCFLGPSLPAPFLRLLRFPSTALSTILLISILTFYSVKTVQQNSRWGDPVSLWSSNIKISITGRALSNLAAAYLARGEIEKAQAEFERVAKLEPGVSEAHSILGQIYARTGDEKKAIEEYEKAIAMRTSNPEVHNYLGIAYEKQGDLMRAAYEYNVATILNPRYVEAYNRLGAIYDQAGFGTAALVNYQKALAIDPDYPHTYYNLALVYAHMGNKREAKRQWEKFLALVPEPPRGYVKEIERWIP